MVDYIGICNGEDDAYVTKSLLEQQRFKELNIGRSVWKHLIVHAMISGNRQYGIQRIHLAEAIVHLLIEFLRLGAARLVLMLNKIGSAEIEKLTPHVLQQPDTHSQATDADRRVIDAR